MTAMAALPNVAESAFSVNEFDPIRAMTPCNIVR
jgi:hypothetical protein